MVSDSSSTPTGGDAPDAQASQLIYRWRSPTYDLQLAPYEGLRQEAIERLELEPGQLVLDIGCGTGMSLPLLEAAVGPGGRVVGVDHCPEMVAEARQRVARHGWSQVDLVCAPVESAPLPERADAVLFHFTHDLLQSPQALDHVLAHLRPGARVVVTGLKWTSPLYGPLNALVWWHALQSVTTFKDLDAPWRPLQARGVALAVEDRLMGTLFLASGRLP